MSRFSLRSLFRPPSRRSNSFGYGYGSSYGKRSRKKSLPLPVMLALIPLSFLGLEILLRIGVGAMGKADELSGFGGESPQVSAYRLQPTTQDGNAIAGLEPGTLKVRPAALTGYELLPNQETATVKINDQGLRDIESIPLKKPAGEIRVLLLGSSTAFGTLSSRNNGSENPQDGTIAHSLETQLNQQVQDQKANAKQFRPDVLPYFADEMEKVMKLPPKIRSGQYRVINAAVPGYLTSNSLSQLSTQLVDYQPDVVVLMDGYSDLLVKSDRAAATLGSLDQALTHITGHFFGTLRQGIAGLWNQLYLVKATNAWILKPNPHSELLTDVSNTQGNLVDRFSADDAEVTQRIDRRTRALQKIAQMTASQKIPLLVGLSPEVSQRKNPTENEKRILASLGDRYPKLVQPQYSQMNEAQKKLTGLTPVSLQDALGDLDTAPSKDAFVDAVHLTDSANAAIAKRLINAIAPTLYVDPKPYRAE
jgi:lysophospholipase L1-like esterase